MTVEARTLNVGIIGLGSAGAGAVPAMRAMPYVNVVAAADLNERALLSFRERYGAKTYSSAEELCDDPDVDTVWIASPNLLHRPHAVLAATRDGMVGHRSLWIARAYTSAWNHSSTSMLNTFVTAPLARCWMASGGADSSRSRRGVLATFTRVRYPAVNRANLC